MNCEKQNFVLNKEPSAENYYFNVFVKFTCFYIKKTAHDIHFTVLFSSFDFRMNVLFDARAHTRYIQL